MYENSILQKSLFNYFTPHCFFQQFTPCSHSEVQCWGYSLSKSLSYFLNTLEPGGNEIDVADKIGAV
jgi:hypothetical protein